MKNDYIHIRISEEEKKLLEFYAKASGLSMSAFVRVLIKQKIEGNQKHPTPPFL